MWAEQHAARPVFFRVLPPAQKCRFEVLAVHAGDVRDRNLFRADRLAFSLVRAAPETFCVVAFDHADNAGVRSTWPCGRRARWLILAEVNSAADAFLHAATHAPQPIQTAESMASSTTGCGIRMALAS